MRGKEDERGMKGKGGWKREDGKRRRKKEEEKR